MHFRLLKNTNQIAGMPGTAFNGTVGQVANAEGLALVAMLRRALRDTARRWERNRTLSTLNAMDDRLLQDIGLNRKAPHPARCPNLRHPLGNRVAQGRAICFLISSKPGHRKLPRPIARPASS